MSSRSSSRMWQELGELAFWGIVGGAMFTLPGLPFLVDTWNTWLAYYCGFLAGGGSVLGLLRLARTANPLETVRRKLNTGGISK